MIDELKSLVLDLSAKRLSKADFIKRLSIDNEDLYVVELLNDAFRDQISENVEYALLVGFAFGFPETAEPILSQLLLSPWHQKHEDIAIVLKKLKLDASAPALYEAALSNHSYLEYDDGYALKSKCAWALGAISSELAIQKLRLLQESADEIASEEAKNQLQRIDTST